jgi:gliding motility-associated-like protein
MLVVKRIQLIVWMILVLGTSTVSYAQLSSCANADFEQNSFANWTGTTGLCCPINSITPGIVPGRHTIMTGPGTDPNTNGAVTVVAPGGTFSARLGNDNIGAEAEQLSYQISVDPTNALFIYRYAVVLEDPNHTAQEQPRFEIRVYDANGNPVGCGTYNVYASAGIPGFQTIVNQFGSTIHYKDWTTVGLDLSPYIGQTVTIEFSTGDCSLGGHFGYAYVDCYCSPLQILTDFCSGSNSTTLTAPIGFAAYLWSTGDTTQAITVQNAVVGTQYQCTMTSVTGCTMTLTAILTPTVIASSYGQGAACQNSAQFYDSSIVVTGTPINQWLWSFGDGNTSALQNPLHNYTSPGNYTVSLLVTNMGGCTDTITQNIVIDPQPLSSFSATVVCPGDPTGFTDLSSSPNGSIVAWSWDFGDGSPLDTTVAPVHTYSLPGTYPAELIITDSIGCKDTLLQNITTSPAPVSGFTYLSACVSNQIGFTDTSLFAGTAITGWEWNFGDGSLLVTGTGTPSHNYPASGTYTTTLVVTTATGCTDTVAGPVDVASVPVAAFTSTQPCAGQFVQFSDQSTTLVGNVTGWNWSFGDGGTVTGVQNPTHAYASSGNYTVQLIVTGSNGCLDTIVHQATVLPAPVAAFNYTPVCPGAASTFQDVSTFTGGTINAWSWNFGDGSPLAGIQSTPHTYTTAGAFDVVLVVTGSNGCSDSVSQTVNTEPIPQPGFFVPSGCEDGAVVFPNLSTIASGSITQYDWDFGDGSPADTLISPSHTFTNPGTYFVTLTATSNKGCSALARDEVTIHPRPVSAFSVPLVCPGDTSNFTDLSTTSSGVILDWIWNFGDGSAVDYGTQNPSHAYPTTGTYSVSLIVMNTQGCYDTTVSTAVVNPLPLPSFTVSGAACDGAPVTLTNTSSLVGGSIATSVWNFSDGQVSGLNTPVMNFSPAGNYYGTLIVTGSNGCVDSVTQLIQVLANPVPSITTANTCEDVPVAFAGSAVSVSPVTTWSWGFGAGGSANVQNPSFTYLQPGVYFPTLNIINADGCRGDTSATLVVYHEPVAAMSFLEDCPGVPIQFNDGSSIGGGDTIQSWSWNFGDASPLVTVQNPIHTYALTGYYPLELVAVSNQGCRDTANAFITIYPVPTVTFYSDTVCYGDQTSFRNESTIASGSIVAWNWNFGDNTVSNVFEPQHVYPSGGTFPVTLIATSDMGCMDSATASARVWYLPQPDFVADDTAGCQPHSLQFTDLSSSNDGVITDWFWDFGNGVGDTVPDPAYEYTDAGNYDISLTVTSSRGCTNDTTRLSYITVHALPLAAFTYDPSEPSVFMPKVSFYDQSWNASQWWWDFGDSSSAIIQYPEHIYAQAGIYEITLMVESPEGCRDTAWKVLEVKDDYALWIPNSFTPNNDGKNDAFMVKGFGYSDFTMDIFNRWGDHIFSTANDSEGWDGSYNGTVAAMDVYVYQVQIKDVFGNPHTYNGRVTLVR